MAKYDRLWLFYQLWDIDEGWSLQESLIKMILTSDVGMSILGNIFQNRDNPIDDVICLDIRQNILQLTVGNASNLGLNIIEIFSIVGQKHLELLFTHRLSQLLNL